MSVSGQAATGVDAECPITSKPILTLDDTDTRNDISASTAIAKVS